MKIGSLPPVQHIEGPLRQRSSTGDSAPATKVSLSEDAAFVESMRQHAEPAPFRDDLVSEVRSQLADGTFEARTDLDKVVDGLLAGL